MTGEARCDRNVARVERKNPAGRKLYQRVDHSTAPTPILFALYGLILVLPVLCCLRIAVKLPISRKPWVASRMLQCWDCRNDLPDLAVSVDGGSITYMNPRHDAAETGKRSTYQGPANAYTSSRVLRWKFWKVNSWSVISSRPFSRNVKEMQNCHFPSCCPLDI